MVTTVILNLIPFNLLLEQDNLIYSLLTVDRQSHFAVNNPLGMKCNVFYFKTIYQLCRKDSPPQSYKPLSHYCIVRKLLFVLGSIQIISALCGQGVEFC